ncbi:glycoside hydrolase family 32 protein [Nocardioides pinisoli]|uniref:Glycoside hydrolase family 32 protein n=1 Tax=Nocardioides pinisoli TaxID=2950279 RepID=A0ABT1KYP2_9ACTN|nr:glycoside hydrolase family 32 protein [Nocardioides pinisoli]MCP3422878.1 glycoside hydrolase family 32 protein [Nocardioides pinisoli]
MTHDPSLRPRDHFTPRRGWMNDPNGLVVHDGEHHLFFQHLPDSLVHGPMSWGHAVSTDLLDWTELPIALAATDTEHVWSGSVVHDARNTSGLGVDGVGPLVALWTAHEPVSGAQRQSLSWSVDRGRTWTSYAANPVLDIGSTAFRDPKVLRDGDGWLMVLVLSDERTVETYRSADLLHWEHASSFGPAGSVEGIWECPDLLRVPVEDRDETAVVLLVSVQEGAPAGGSGMQYFVGQLDGPHFRPTQDARWVDHGADFYAAVSYSDAPEPLVQGWMSNWRYADLVPAATHRGSMTLARHLALRPRDGELVLVQRPVVRDSPVVHEVRDVPVQGILVLPVRARTCRVVVDIDPGDARRVGVHVRAGDGHRTTVWLEPASSTVGLDRRTSGETGFHDGFAAEHTAPLTVGDHAVRLEVVVDESSVEVFAGDGEVVLTDLVFPGPGDDGLAVFAEGGTALVQHLVVQA